MKNSLNSAIKTRFSTLLLLFTFTSTFSYGQGKVMEILTGKKPNLRQSKIYTNTGDSILCFIEDFDSREIIYKLKTDDEYSKVIQARDVKEFMVLSRRYERVMTDSTHCMFLEIMEQGKLMFYRKVYTYMVVQPIGHTYGSYGKTRDEEDYYVRTSGKDNCIQLTGTKKHRYEQIFPYVQDNPEAIRRIDEKIYGLKEFYLLVAYYNKWYAEQNPSSK